MASRNFSNAAPATGDRVEAALALRACGRLRDALDLLTGPGDFSQDAYTLRGDLQLELGQFHEALGSYSTVIAFERHNMYAHHHLALCLCRLERWEPAAEMFQKILAHDSYSDAAHIGLGDCLLHLNRPAEALACFEACWSESARLHALFGKAAAMQLLRRFDEAEALYERVLELNPESEEALGNLIAMSVEGLDLARVQRHAQRQLDICPQSAIALQGLTLVAFERRDYANAAGYLADLKENAPDGGLPSNEAPGDAIEYRLSGEDVERLSRIRHSRSAAASAAPGRWSY